MSQKRQQFTLPITCPNCSAMGAVVWEEAGSKDRTRGAERRLVMIHGEFHREDGRTTSGDPMIVCTFCDEIQPD